MGGPVSGPLGSPVRGPRSGEPLPPPLHDPLRDPLPLNYPPPPEPSPALRDATSAVDSAAVRRSVAETDGLYRSKKPIFLAIYIGLTAIGELMMVRPFFRALFEITSLAPLLAMIAFPLLAMGLYGLSTGAATAVQFQGPRVWLRTPLVYLPIALVLLVAAGTAVV